MNPFKNMKRYQLIFLILMGTASLLAQTPTVASLAATGNTGPNQAQVNAAYSGTSLAGGVTVNTQGIQEWTVPATGTYRIEAYGAQGGNIGGYIGGLGAKIIADFNLTSGDHY